MRFYTYLSDDVLCARSRRPTRALAFVVLDRPNPLGGERVEGPRRPIGVGAALASSAALPGPLVHGLTAGEMARLLNAASTRSRRRLTMSCKIGRLAARRCAGATPGAPGSRPRRTCAPPTPRIAYPGTCLLEATNVSEGRGTPMRRSPSSARPGWTRNAGSRAAVARLRARRRCGSRRTRVRAAPSPKFTGRSAAGCGWRPMPPLPARRTALASSCSRSCAPPHAKRQFRDGGKCARLGSWAQSAARAARARPTRRPSSPRMRPTSPRFADTRAPYLLY